MGPLLFGLVGSVYRASRLLALAPLYSLLAGLGAVYLWQEVGVFRQLLVIILILILINFYDFTSYYWYAYSKAVQGYFSSTSDENYRILAEEAGKRGLTAYIDSNIYKSDGEIAHFLEAAFFDKPLVLWYDSQDVPSSGSILMSNREEIPGLVRLDVGLPNYYLFIND